MVASRCYTTVLDDDSDTFLVLEPWLSATFDAGVGDKNICLWIILAHGELNPGTILANKTLVTTIGQHPTLHTLLTFFASYHQHYVAAAGSELSIRTSIPVLIKNTEVRQLDIIRPSLYLCFPQHVGAADRGQCTSGYAFVLELLVGVWAVRTRYWPYPWLSFLYHFPPCRHTRYKRIVCSFSIVLELQHFEP